MVLFPPPFYFVFDISKFLSYIQNISSNELARPVMGTIFLVKSIIINKVDYNNSYMYVCMYVYKYSVHIFYCV